MELEELKEEVDLINNSHLDTDLFALIMDAKEVKLRTKSCVESFSVFILFLS